MPLLAFAQVRIPASTHADLQKIEKLAGEISSPRELVKQLEGKFPVALIGGRCMVGFLGKGVVQPEGNGSEHVMLGSRIGDVLSFRIDAGHLELLHSIEGLKYAELAGVAQPELNKVVKAIHADSVHRGINLPQAYTGKDVLIGITDWGFDYTHPMFYDTLLAESRVRAAWDQYKNSGPAPSNFNYGAEYATIADLLAAQSDTANIYSHHTHGTHVAGIAGGSGAGTQYRGVAFESQFLFCTFLIDAAAVLDAFTWMKQIADQDQKRLVVNMSWGLHYMGTLDGNSVLSQAIDQLSQEGVVFVNSAGNNGDVDFHIKREFTGDTIRSRVQFYSYAANPNMWGQSLSMWGEPGGSFAAGFDVVNNTNSILHSGEWFQTSAQQAYTDSFYTIGADTVFFNLTVEAAHPLNGRPHFRLRIKNTNGSLRIVMKATAASGTVHFWNVTELTNGVGNWGQAFQTSGTGTIAGDHFYGISEPACTESLIATAAYLSESTSSSGNPIGGTIASFSSFGPTLDERIKPDISAPGVTVISSISTFTDANYTPVTSVDFEGFNYPFAQFSGTSMAAPAVTGVVALMLEADPTLIPADVKEIIQLTARTDNHTGIIPPGGSTRWGMGKVNAYRAVAQTLGVVGVPEFQAGQIQLWPNPSNDVVHLLLPEEMQNSRIEILDIAGRSIDAQSVFANGIYSIEVDRFPAGIYFLRVAGQPIVGGRFVKQ